MLRFILEKTLGTCILICTFAASAQSLPRPDHIIVLLESKARYDEVIGNSNGAYLNSLATQGAVFSSFFSQYRSIQPNYLMLFAGDTFSITGDHCQEATLLSPSLGGELLKNGLTFGGYAENLPSVGSTECKFGKYARRNAPWVNFADVPPNLSRPLSQLPCRYETLPTVSFVAPNNDNNMDDGSVATADRWLNNYFDSYVLWARTNNSLLIVTWAEDGKLFPHKTEPPRNRVPMVVIGSMVKNGVVSTAQYTHLNLLRTIEEMYGLSFLGQSGNVTAIVDIWK
jgi:phosphatidylinositol-3-phosphatase